MGVDYLVDFELILPPEAPEGITTPIEVLRPLDNVESVVYHLWGPD